MPHQLPWCIIILESSLEIFSNSFLLQPCSSSYSSPEISSNSSLSSPRSNGAKRNHLRLSPALNLRPVVNRSYHLPGHHRQGCRETTTTPRALNKIMHGTFRIGIYTSHYSCLRTSVPPKQLTRLTALSMYTRCTALIFNQHRVHHLGITPAASRGQAGT